VTPTAPGPNTPSTPPSFAEALAFWFQLGWISFGGPAGQIAIMHRELVERRRWLSEPAFLHGLNFCMLLPGPEAQQLAIYLGWRMHGIRGGVVAGTLFVLPSALILFALSWLYVLGADVPWIAAALRGLLAAVLAIIAAAALRIGRKALRSPALWGVATAAFVALATARISFVAVVLGAAAIGWVGHARFPRLFPGSAGHGHDPAPATPATPRPHPIPHILRVAATCLALWWAPVFATAAALGWESTAARQALFFSRAALVTFGGAYAVLPYVAQQAVEHHGWLSHGQMMAGLALAETTPGPLIMVLQFVGFVGGWNHPGALAPLASATWCALLTTWVTFVPCFLFVLAAAPSIERIGEHRRLDAALTAVTAAVVGVIAHLATTLARHALWPQPGNPDLFVATLALAAFAVLVRWKSAMIPLIAACALAGAIAAAFR
jgi:chromate transporter